MLVKVYIADITFLNDSNRYSEACDRLPQSRLDKALRMKTNKVKLQSVGAGWLLSKALEEFGIEYKSAKVSEDKFGKPYLVDYPDIYFNLSHSENRVMCAVANTPVGCDVEFMKTERIDIAKRFFTDGEYERIVSCSKEKQKETFYRFWTLKESYIKAVGEGLRIPLDSFEIVLGEHINIDDYHFKEYDLDDGYRYSICGQMKGGDIAFELKVM